VDLLLPEFPRIHAVLMLVGLNDLTVALMSSDEYVQPKAISDPGARREQARKTFVMEPGSWHEPRTDYLLAKNAAWHKRTAIWQLLKRARIVVESRFAHRLTQDEGGLVLNAWREHRRESKHRRDDLPDLSPALAEYRRNLDAVVDAAERHSTRLVLVTQPALWRSDLSAEDEDRLWLGGIGDFQVESQRTYYTVDALRRALDRFNGVLLEVCSDRGVECLDLASRIPRTSTIFFDDVHFTEEGARAVAREIASYMKGLPPFVAERTVEAEGPGDDG
jgi:hypothetical protein